MAAPDQNEDQPVSEESAEPPASRGGPLSSVIRPFSRASRYYTQSWRDYLNGKPDELPVARPTFALAAQALGDEIVISGLLRTRPVSEPAAFERITREVEAALEFYGRKGWLAKPEGFFTAPPPLRDMSLHRVKRRRRSYQRFVFESGYAPHPDAPGRERWLSYTANNLEYGLMLRHPRPRPWLVCVHGTEMGRAGLDLTLFRAWHLHEDLGLNVVLPVLPLHGPRKRGVPKGAVLPGEDVMDDVHAAAQSVWDIRRVISWIRSQEPQAPIGLDGISLGGYVASLVASLEDGLRCAILGVPVADLIDLLARHSGLSRDDPRFDTIQRAKPIGRMISPLALQPRVPRHGRFIYGGVADRLVRPREHVIRLWEHWGKPEIVWYRGGHAGFFGARPVQQFIDAALVQSGLVGS